MRLFRLRRGTRNPQQKRPLPFTEAQIRERAYSLWQADPEGSAEAHWDGAIKALKRERSPLWKVRRLFGLAFTAETPGAALDVLKFVLSAFGVLATVFAGVGLYLTYRTGQAQFEAAQQERQLNSERLVTDRFSKAVEQLGSQAIDVRIGAIYSLERIAKDSPKDQGTIIEVLIAFVGTQSPLPESWWHSKQKLPRVTIDVQAALNVIRRRQVEHDPEPYFVALQGTNLEGAHLERAQLQQELLWHANFEDAYFYQANLRETYFMWSKLKGVLFWNANLEKATLWKADLEKALLWNADLKGANLEDVDLQGADLKGANLERADLKGAALQDTKNITTAQIKKAKNWQEAHYDPAFRQQLGLPPEKPSP